MLKWILRILYAIFIVVIGIFVYNEAMINRRVKYLEEHAQEHYNNNEISKYLDEYYVAAERTEYLINPLYSATSTQEDYSFDFSIYHSRVKINDNYLNVIGFLVHNININVEVNDLENYEENHNLLRFKTNIKYSNPLNSTVHEMNFEGAYMPTNQPYSMGVPIPIEVQIGENDAKQPVFLLGETVVSDIESIEFSLIDSSLDLENPTETLIAVLESNKDTEQTSYLNIEEELSLKPYTYITKDEEGEDVEVTTDVLQAELFNGLADRYEVSELYETEEVGTTDIDLLNQYDNIVFKFMGIYFIAVGVLTYLLFFIKPTINYFQGRKFRKSLNEENTGS